ncbi:MAG TPA: methyltransferase domain-containing protein [Candidatus Angelobacter sp.]|nr:methyltransferase domain-containing protein [Candidatus Angelobacter sp.]
MKTTVKGENRFESDAGRYAAYLETAEGRLRLDLALTNLQEFLPACQPDNLLPALDIGCGTGATAVRLARLGFHVTLLDSSQAMLDIAQRAANDAGVSDHITAKYGDIIRLTSLFNTGSFDVILCHNVLEYVEDPAAVMRGVAPLLRDSSGILSVLVRSQAGEVLKAAIQSGDLAGAKDALTSEWTQESLYGGKVRLFTLDNMRDILKAASFRIIAERGVRIIADYLPSKVSRVEEYGRILELERKLGKRAEFTAAARYIHLLACASRLKDRA